MVTPRIGTRLPCKRWPSGLFQHPPPAQLASLPLGDATAALVLSHVPCERSLEGPAGVDPPKAAGFSSLRSEAGTLAHCSQGFPPPPGGPRAIAPASSARRYRETAARPVWAAVYVAKPSSTTCISSRSRSARRVVRRRGEPRFPRRDLSASPRTDGALRVRDTRARQVDTIDANLPARDQVQLQQSATPRRYTGVLLSTMATKKSSDYGRGSRCDGARHESSRRGTARFPADRAGDFTQTTLSVDETGEIITAPTQPLPEYLRAEEEDICYAPPPAVGGQGYANEIELLLVIGSRNSSNSKPARRDREQPARRRHRRHLLDDETRSNESWSLRRGRRVTSDIRTRKLVERVCDWVPPPRLPEIEPYRLSTKVSIPPPTELRRELALSRTRIEPLVASLVRCAYDTKLNLELSRYESWLLTRSSL